MRFLTLLLCCSITFAQEPNPVFAPVPDVPGIPRVLLIGDSISIGYTLRVRGLLEGKANVHRVPDNAGPTTHGIQFLEYWLGKEKWDVIHFNFGLHDLKSIWDDSPQVSIEDYERNLRRILRRLKQTGAQLIWASTTPVPDDKVDPPRTDADVVRYNRAASVVMRENGIPIDDLYAAVRPRLSSLQLKSNVHFTREGYDSLARQVSASIMKTIEQVKEPARR